MFKEIKKFFRFTKKIDDGLRPQSTRKKEKTVRKLSEYERKTSYKNDSFKYKAVYDCDTIVSSFYDVDCSSSYSDSSSSCSSSSGSSSFD